MKKSSKQWNRTLSFVMAFTMLLGIVFSGIPLSTDTYVATESETTDEVISDETVIAQRDTFENTILFDYVADYMGREDATELTYGDVKDYEWFNIYEIWDENDELLPENQITSLEGLDILMPNLYGLEIETKYVTDYTGIPASVTEIRVQDEEVELEDLLFVSHLTTLDSLYLDIADICSLEGIENCINLKYLTIMDYQYEEKGLTLSSLKELEELSELTELTIGYSNIGNEAMESIAKLTNLYDLTLIKNKNISLLPDDMFTNMENLKCLEVSNTSLTSFPDISGMETLEYLYLYGNQITKSNLTDKIPAIFADSEEWWIENYSCNAVITTGDKVSDYYIPDQNLYALLLEYADYNEDGILMLSEASDIHDLYIYWENGISTFEGLSQVAANLQYVYVYNSDLTVDAKATLYTELKELKNLTILRTYDITQDDFESICELENLTDLEISHYNYEDDETPLDLTNIVKLVNITDLDIDGYNYTNTDAISGLTSLTYFYDYADEVSVLNLSKEQCANLVCLRTEVETQEEIDCIESMVNIIDLYVSSYKEDLEIMDFSVFNELEELSLSFYNTEQVLDLSVLTSLRYLLLDGSYKTVTLPEKAQSLYVLCLYNNGDELGEITNLQAENFSNIEYLQISRYKVNDLTEISKMTGLYQLSLYNTDLLSTDGIGNLTKLWNLEIVGNKNLTTIDEDIEKLVNLVYLNLSYNHLESLPDLSALCTKDGLLWGSDWSIIADYLDLRGNCLTEEAILAANLTEEFTKDANWMIEATSRSFTDYWGNDQLYYPELSASYVYRQMYEDYMSYFYTTSDFTLPVELLEYIVDESEWLYIYMISPEYPNVYQEYCVSPDTLEEWDGESEVVLEKATIEVKDTDETLAQYFSKTPLHYIIMSDWEKTPYADTWMHYEIDVPSTDGGGMNLYVINLENGQYIDCWHDAYEGWTYSHDFKKSNIAWVVTDFETENIQGYDEPTQEEPDTDVPGTDGDDVVTPGDATESCAHNALEHYAAVEPGCHSLGNVEHWYCPDCYTYFADEECQIITNDLSVNLPATEDGDVSHVAAKAPTYDATGNLEYWYCNDCKTYFANEDCTIVTNALNVTLAKLELPSEEPSTSETPSTSESESTTESESESESESTTESESESESESTTESESESESESTTESESESESESTTESESESESESTTESESESESESTTESENESESESTTESEKPPIVLPEIDLKEETKEENVNSAPSTVKQNTIVAVKEAVDKIIDKMASTIKPVVEVVTKNVAPEMTENLFAAAKENNKDITIGVTNENNQLMYSWTFDYQKIDMNKVTKSMDLSISFATEKQKEIEEVTGQTNGLYIAIDGYSGELPAPATVKTYVGDKYKNGEIIYLYYYNEETQKVETVGNGPLKVEGGYVTYTLTHCSIYFLSENTPDVYGLEEVVPDTETTGPCEHDLVHVDAVAATHDKEGNIEHWYCTKCEIFWQNEALTEVTNSKRVITPAKGCADTIVPYEAVEPGCHSLGQIAHWYCTECDTYYANEDCTIVTNGLSIILPATGSDKVEYVAAVAPTATKDGNSEYWYCNDCKTYYADENCTIVTNVKNIVVPATGEVVSAPQTGDNANIALWVSILGIGVVAMVASVVMKKRTF